MVKILESKRLTYLQGSKGDFWHGCCHSCNRAVSVAGVIGDDGLCDMCRSRGNTAWW